MTDYLPWTCYLAETRTGKVLDEITLADEPDWDAAINADGSIQVRTLVEGVADDALRSYGTDGGRIALALTYGEAPDGKIVQAGPIWNARFDDHSKVLTLQAMGIWSLLSRRLLISPGWQPPNSLVSDAYDTVFAGKTLPFIAKSLVDRLKQHPNGSLPIDTPLSVSEGGSMPEDGAHDRTYVSHETATYGQRLRELTQVIDGPDIVFHPYFAAHDQIRWQMLVGDPYLAQSEQDPVFEYPGNLYYISVQLDSTQRATEVVVRGNGSERALTFSYASSLDLTDAGWPAISHIDSSHTSASDQATLDGWSAAILQQQTGVVETWDVTTTIGGQPGLADYLPGFRVRYNVNGHNWVPDGDYRFRLIGYGSGRNPGEVKHVLDARGVDV
jgi:hypothetical protein